MGSIVSVYFGSLTLQVISTDQPQTVKRSNWVGWLELSLPTPAKSKGSAACLHRMSQTAPSLRKGLAEQKATSEIGLYLHALHLCSSLSYAEMATSRILSARQCLLRLGSMCSSAGVLGCPVHNNQLPKQLLNK